MNSVVTICGRVSSLLYVFFFFFDNAFFVCFVLCWRHSNSDIISPSPTYNSYSISLQSSGALKKSIVMFFLKQSLFLLSSFCLSFFLSFFPFVTRHFFPFLSVFLSFPFLSFFFFLLLVLSSFLCVWVHFFFVYLSPSFFLCFFFPFVLFFLLSCGDSPSPFLSLHCLLL